MKKLDSIVEDLYKFLKNVPKDLSTEEQVKVGVGLDTIVKLATKDLESIKVALRQKALHQNNQQAGTVDIKPGVCLVRIPSATVAVKKNFNMSKLKDNLGQAFPTVFSEIISFKPQTDFQEAVSQCTAEQKAEIMGAIELQDNSPQVFFTPKEF